MTQRQVDEYFEKLDRTACGPCIRKGEIGQNPACGLCAAEGILKDMGMDYMIGIDASHDDDEEDGE